MTGPTSFDLLVAGGAAIDYTIRAEALPSGGRSVSGDAFLRDCGGKGLNQAVAAARLGARASLAAAIGEDPEGDEVIRALREEGVDATAVVRVTGALTARTLINVDAEGRKQTSSFPAANARFDESHLSATFVSRASVVLVQLEIPSTAVLQLARVARHAGVRFVLDAAPAMDVSNELLELSSVVTVNDDEAAAISGRGVHDQPSAFAAARIIQRRGAAGVSVGLAPGRAIVTADGELWLPAYDVPVVDTTGAGDACAAGIAVGLHEGRSVPDACRFGHAAAALSVTRLGARASLPFRAAVDALALRQPL